MKAQKDTLEVMIARIDDICGQARSYEKKYAEEIAKVEPSFRESALNLVHYLALRNNDIRDLQKELGYSGLASLSKVEGHVLASLCATRKMLKILTGKKSRETADIPVTIKKGVKLLNNHTKALFGSKSKGRKTRIMVTLPREASSDYKLVYELIRNGINVARINCAHDDEEIWEKIIINIRKAEASLGRTCKIIMDLGGPKLRTGPMMPGPKVAHLIPPKDEMGRVIKPSLVWISTENSLPPAKADAFIPASAKWISEIKKGDEIQYKDARGKKCTLKVIAREGKAAWAHSYDSAYITPGLEINLIKHDVQAQKTDHIGDLTSIEQTIILRKGDNLILHKDTTPGEPAHYNESGKLTRLPHISCTLPEVFKDLKAGEPILFDDGKIEGIIKEVTDEKLHVTITFARESGSKLRADKGINLPESNLSVSGLTEKDKKDLHFIIQHADAINLSFVNGPEDVINLLSELKRIKATIGIILKIETRKGFQYLPEILLTAMRTYPVGVMIARGDMVIECGWKYMAKIQYEILRLCEAAHIPNIYATQVLEGLAKKGMPSRAEITDAASSQQAECVMLNKGPYIIPAIRMLDKILRNTEKYQDKQATLLPILDTKLE
ncbi:MAG: pyruvate kinase [Bacteroidetes bacterium]|nr:pyruvate kinase [Bacteroidota bacterium]